MKKFLRPNPEKLILMIWLIFISFLISSIFFSMNFCDFTFDCGSTIGIPLPIYTRDPATSRNLFNWEEVPGKDNDRLIDFLKNGYKGREFVGMFGKDRVNIHKIEKIDNNTINVFYENINLSLRLNNEKNDMNITINGPYFWSFDHIGVNYIGGSIYGMSYAKPEIYYHLIILQLLLWYMISSFILEKYESRKKNILKKILYFFIAIAILLLILKNGMFFFVIMSIFIARYFLENKDHYSETRKSIKFTTYLTLLSYPWALYSADQIVYLPDLFYLLLPYIIIITGTFTGKFFNNPIQLGIMIYIMPFVMGSLFTILFLFDQDLYLRIIINSTSLLTKVIIGLVFVLIGSFLIPAIFNDESKI